MGEGGSGRSARIERVRLRGADGLLRFAPPGRCRALDPGSFAADITRVRLDGLTIDRISASPCRLRGGEVGRDPHAVRLLALIDGSGMAGRPGLAPLRIQAGGVAAAHVGPVSLYQASTRVDLVTIAVPLALLPPCGDLFVHRAVHPFERSALLDAFVGLAIGLTALPEPGPALDSVYTANGLIDLMGALVADARPSRPSESGVERVYEAAVDVIERRLRDPELAPARVAAELGVSLRYLHLAFDGREHTVARYISARRLDLVVQAVTESREAPSPALLAHRFGFGTESRMSRAYTRRFDAPPPW